MCTRNSSLTEKGLAGTGTLGGIYAAVFHVTLKERLVIS